MELRVQVKGEREKREKGREWAGDEREKLREREKTRKERGQKWREKD